MPKVSETYLIEKKNEILDAAFEVCKRKPAYEVTMSDIVAVKAQHEGALTPPCIIRKDPRVPHTARRGA